MNISNYVEAECVLFIYFSNLQSSCCMLSKNNDDFSVVQYPFALVLLLPSFLPSDSHLLLNQPVCPPSRFNLLLLHAQVAGAVALITPGFLAGLNALSTTTSRQTTNNSLYRITLLRVGVLWFQIEGECCAPAYLVWNVFTTSS